MTFTNIKINDLFITEKSFRFYDGNKIEMTMVFKKISKSKAICIEQIGYGNTRLVNTISHFYPNSIIYKI